jgi:hypothetical protein
VRRRHRRQSREPDMVFTKDPNLQARRTIQDSLRPTDRRQQQTPGIHRHRNRRKRRRAQTCRAPPEEQVHHQAHQGPHARDPQIQAGKLWILARSGGSGEWWPTVNGQRRSSPNDRPTCAGPANRRPRQGERISGPWGGGSDEGRPDAGERWQAKQPRVRRGVR